MKGHLISGCMVFVSTAAFAVFEKIAYIDSIDYAADFETESAEGSARIVDNVLKTGATMLLWRNQNGALPAYPSAEEAVPLKEPPIDKRRIPLSRSALGWVRYDDCGTDLVCAAREACLRRGVRFGFHVTTEENHSSGWTLGSWNLEHPEFWCCRLGETPWPGHCSRAYPEVRAHKQRLFSELLGYQPEMVVFDVHRSGGWTPAQEYVEPVEREWRRLYACEPPADATDARWTALVSKYVFTHFSGLRKQSLRGGRPIEIVMSVERYGGPVDYNLVYRGIDWRRMLRSDVIDAVAVASIAPDWQDPWGSTERIYGDAIREVRSIDAKKKVYFPIMSYNFNERPGYMEYAKRCGIAPEEAVRRLLRLAKDVGGNGITMEVVDHKNYSPEVCSVIRDFR